MRNSFLVLACIGIFGSVGMTAVSAQTPAASPVPALSGIKANLAAGEVAAISQADNKISLKTSDGMIDAVLSATTVYKRISPENPSISAAAASSLSEISVGDKIVVTGAVASDKKTIPAKQVLILTKADLSKRDVDEREMWRTRGITGRVTAVDFRTQQVTIAPRGGAPGTPQSVALTPKENVSYLRYSGDSVKFSDAKPSSLAEIKVGDEVRALGDKSEDGATFKAERVLSGSFKTVVGTITAIDAAKNEITIKETQTNKLVTVAVNSNSVLKKFPAEMATMMSGGMPGGSPGAPGQNGTFVMTRPGSGGGQPQGAPQGAQPGGQRPAGAPGQGRVFGGGQGGMRTGDLDAMLNRFPNITVADLKVGEAIGVSSTAGAMSERYTAIKLLAGVEPFIAAAQASRAAGRGQGQSLDIPGLDGGFGAP